MTYGGQYVHIADLEPLVNGLVENYPVVKGSEDDTSTAGRMRWRAKEWCGARIGGQSQCAKSVIKVAD